MGNGEATCKAYEQSRTAARHAVASRRSAFTSSSRWRAVRVRQGGRRDFQKVIAPSPGHGSRSAAERLQHKRRTHQTKSPTDLDSHRIDSQAIHDAANPDTPVTRTSGLSAIFSLVSLFPSRAKVFVRIFSDIFSLSWPRIQSFQVFQPPPSPPHTHTLAHILTLPLAHAAHTLATHSTTQCPNQELESCRPRSNWDIAENMNVVLGSLMCLTVAAA
jgi:hypothetical protein